ncbi:unnamed protein product [Haemonchus placei]|uniref:SSD domain-containing protein n=1 Tax=Haemonchus placei TaxID=6290 RepID=A0A0N4WWR7_HAEPC|nr:unnamed protein product [Haemonchus placei]
MVGFSVQTLAELEFATSIIGSRELVTAASVMLAVGAFALVTAPLGLLAAMATYSPVTLTYAILMFFICLLSIVGCCFGFRLHKEIDSGVILEWMNSSLQAEYGNPFANDLTLAWDQLHEKYACCGITDQTSTTDWLNSYWFITYDRWVRLYSREGPVGTVVVNSSKLGSELKSEISYPFISEPLAEHYVKRQSWNSLQTKLLLQQQHIDFYPSKKLFPSTAVEIPDGRGRGYQRAVVRHAKQRAAMNRCMRICSTTQRERYWSRL